MAAKALKVAIIGAGVGGLCLAQGLRKAGVDVEVFERDRTPEARMRGYRLSISPTGARALASCLPADAFDRLKGDTARPSRTVSFLDHRLVRWLAFDLPDHDRASLDSERPIGRLALRKALLHGLDDAVRFDKKFVDFEENDENKVIARFDDGSEVSADVLVGADGASSALRRRLLPGPARLDTGVVAIGGKTSLGGGERATVPGPILTGPTMMLGPRGRFMFASAVAYDDLGAEAVDRAEYITWGFSAPKEQLPFGNDQDGVEPEHLRREALSLMSDWDAAPRRIVAEAEVSSLTAFAVKSAIPVEPWRTRRVTLLGDALHNMPPYRGVGANAALWDAEVLSRALSTAARGETSLLEALADYERRAIDHGFLFVRRSLAATRAFHSTNPLRRAFTKLAFRVFDRSPFLRDRAFGDR